MKKGIHIIVSALLLLQSTGFVFAQEPQIEVTVVEQAAQNTSIEEPAAENELYSVGEENINGENRPIENEPEENVTEENRPIENEQEENPEDNSISFFGNGNGEGWSFQSNFITARTNMQMLELSGVLYAVGGDNSTGVVQTIEKYNGSSWLNVASLPDKREGYTAAADGDDLYIAGGYKDGCFLNEVLVYHAAANTWETLPTMLRNRDQASAFYTGGKLYVFGGRDMYGIVSSYEYYDTQTGVWQEVTTGFDSSMIRIGARIAGMDGAVCMIGGMTREYLRGGADVYALPDLNQRTNLLPEDTYDHIVIAQGQEKALLFSEKYEEMVYETWELSIADGVEFVPATTADRFSNGAYGSEMVMYDGYLYCMGGCVPEARAYAKFVYKYRVYYGDFIVGDQEITSVTTTGGNELTLNVEAQKEYLVFVEVKNIPSFSGYTFTVEYDADGMELLDGCALTAEQDQIGAVEGSNIEITENVPGRFSFVSTDPVASGKAVSGVINAVRLRATESGQRKIIYRMTQE